METLAVAISGIGLLFALVGMIWLIVAAFRQGIVWGLCCLFIPGASLIFLVVHWGVAARPFGLGILGVLIAVGGGGAAAFPALREGWKRGMDRNQQADRIQQSEGELIAKEAKLNALASEVAALEKKLTDEYESLNLRRAKLSKNPAEVEAFNQAAAAYTAAKTQLDGKRQSLQQSRTEVAQLTEAVFAQAREARKRAGREPDLVGRESRSSSDDQARLARARSADIVMYTTSSCPACVAAKRYFQGRGLTYKEIDVQSSREGFEEFRRLGGRGVPLIQVNGQTIHGFDRRRLDSML
jgi:glutaredoxin